MEKRDSHFKNKNTQALKKNLCKLIDYSTSDRPKLPSASENI